MLKVRKCHRTARSFDIISMVQIIVLDNHSLDFLLQGLNPKVLAFSGQSRNKLIDFLLASESL